MSKLVLNPEYQVKKLADLFRTGVPELDASLDDFDRALSAPLQESKKSVYVIGFMDGVSKVGISKSPERRILAIAKQSGRTIDEYRVSNLLPAKSAFEIECLMKQVLADYRLEGEFFNTPFKKVVGLFEYYLEDHEEGQV